MQKPVNLGHKIIAESDPQALFNYVAEKLSGNIVYLHVIEGDTYRAIRITPYCAAPLTYRLRSFPSTSSGGTPAAVMLASVALKLLADHSKWGGGEIPYETIWPAQLIISEDQ